MPLIVDAHLDLAYNAVVLNRDLLRPLQEVREQDARTPPPGLPCGSGLVSLPELWRGQIPVIGASIFTCPALRRWEREAQVYHTSDEAHAQGVAHWITTSLADEQIRVRPCSPRRTGSCVASWRHATPTRPVHRDGGPPTRSRPGELPGGSSAACAGGMAWSQGAHAGGCAAPGGISEEGDVCYPDGGANLMLDGATLERGRYAALDSTPGPCRHPCQPATLVGTPASSPTLIRRIAERAGVMGSSPSTRCSSWLARRRPGLRSPVSLKRLNPFARSRTSRLRGLGSDFDGGFGWKLCRKHEFYRPTWEDCDTAA
jgi:membrane dipeptidase